MYNDDSFKIWKRKEDNIIKDVRNLSRLKNETHDTTIKDVRNLFRLSKENKAVKDRVIRDIRKLFEHEEDYYKQVKVGDFSE